MQEKLDKLSAFCSDWCLDINIKKNKSLVFNKVTVLQDWCFFYALPKEMYRTSSVTFHNVV
jgi:hypothetical protein